MDCNYSQKLKNYVPGKHVILAGSHPFILIAAKNIIDSGGHIEGIAFSQHIPNIKDLFEYHKFICITENRYKKNELDTIFKEDNCSLGFPVKPTLIGEFKK